MHPDNVTLFQSRMEIFRVEGRLNGIHVAAELAAGEPERKEQLSATGRIDGIIDAVVGVRRRDGGGADTAELIGPTHTLEIDVSEIIRGRRGEGLNVRNVVTEGQSQACEATLQRIRNENRAAVTVLDIVQ